MTKTLTTVRTVANLETRKMRLKYGCDVIINMFNFSIFPVKRLLIYSFCTVYKLEIFMKTEQRTLNVRSSQKYLMTVAIAANVKLSF